ncbi:hypothetical protein F5Y15DRAFT_419788 [Xylariaceae sp. FL0016]|nr:hypothetical protein F5Y15DRAFT_419788 [Xylariaceae sp. FL0016]
MAEAYCAATISNIEGWRRIQLPTGDSWRVNLENLDHRLRRLENIARISSPPPMVEPCWDSLTWRVCRLQQGMACPSFARAGPLHISPSMILLKKTTSVLRITAPMAVTRGTESWPETESFSKSEQEAEEQTILTYVTQWICHLAGQHCYKIVPGADFELADLRKVCVLALELSLAAEPPRSTPGMMRNTGVQSDMAISRNCYGCCGCVYHRHQQLDSPPRSVSIDRWAREPDKSVLSWLSRRKPEKSRNSGWLSKLAFWRRRSCGDSGSETSSIGSGSSSTVLD